MPRAIGMWTVDFFAEFPLVAAHTLALATDAMTMTITISHLALIVTKGALLALPARITNALAIDVLSVLRAEHRTYAFTAIITTESGITLAMTQQTLSIARASVRTVLRHVLGYGCIEGQLLHIPIIVVE